MEHLMEKLFPALIITYVVLRLDTSHSNYRYDTEFLPMCTFSLLKNRNNERVHVKITSPEFQLYIYMYFYVSALVCYTRRIKLSSGSPSYIMLLNVPIILHLHLLFGIFITLVANCNGGGFMASSLCSTLYCSHIKVMYDLFLDIFTFYSFNYAMPSRKC